jgi:hypothetical protein
MSLADGVTEELRLRTPVTIWDVVVAAAAAAAEKGIPRHVVVPGTLEGVLSGIPAKIGMYRVVSGASYWCPSSSSLKVRRSAPLGRLVYPM